MDLGEDAGKEENVTATDVSTDLRAAIAAADAQFADVFKQRDAAGMAALYTETGELLPPNADVVAGREALQGFWQAVMDMGIQEAELDIVEVMDLGDTAVEVGRYVLYAPERQVADKGKYIVVWQKQDGQWKLHRDIFNSSLPAPGG